MAARNELAFLAYLVAKPSQRLNDNLYQIIIFIFNGLFRTISPIRQQMVGRKAID
jgi:hypothetical protein